MADVITINPAVLDLAKEIFEGMASQRPEHSISFMLPSEGAEAVTDTIKIVEWGIGGNKPKIKSTALEVLAEMAKVPAGAPVNANLTEYELKAMEEVVVAIDKAIDGHQEGVLS